MNGLQLLIVLAEGLVRLNGWPTIAAKSVDWK